jgi:hypothetical protein
MSGIPIITLDNLVSKTLKINNIINKLTDSLILPNAKKISDYLVAIKETCNFIKNINENPYLTSSILENKNEINIDTYIKHLDEYKQKLEQLNFTQIITKYKLFKFNESSGLPTTNLKYYHLNVLRKQLKDLLKHNILKYNEIFEQYKSIMIPYYKKKYNNIISKTNKLHALLQKYLENINILKKLYKLLNKNNNIPSNININAIIQHIISSTNNNIYYITNNIFNNKINYFGDVHILDSKNYEIINLMREMISSIIEIKIRKNIRIIREIIDEFTATSFRYAYSYVFGKKGEYIMIILNELVKYKNYILPAQITIIHELFTEAHIIIFKVEDQPKIRELLSKLNDI